VPVVKVMTETLVGKLSASFKLLPPSLIVICQTCIPVVEISGGALFIREEISVGELLGTAITSELEEGVLAVAVGIIACV